MNENIVGVGSYKAGTNKKIDLYDNTLVSTLINKSLVSGGLGKINSESPLKDIIKPGMSVLMKPNWVFHKNKKNKGPDCLLTHKIFIEEMLKKVVDCSPSKIIIGDAPVQGCDFNKIVTNEWARKLKEISNDLVEIIDFRRTVIRNDKNYLDSGVDQNIRELNRYILFNLGENSRLESISMPEGKFRVTMYDPNLMAETHKIGKHQYLISKEPFEADVILNLPKLKTHQKAGMTGALKNLVGINGNKDYLPHHRIGGSNFNGDCYPGYGLDKRFIEFLFDKANSRINKKSYKYFTYPAHILLNLRKVLKMNSEITGGWYGNDTVWRMTLDLNTILLYGNIDGTINNKQMRNVYSITDAIIAGDTNGPLSVEPVNLGIVTFSSSSSFSDLIHTYLMHFDWKKIPVIKESFNNYNFPLVNKSPNECRVIVNDKEISLDELSKKYGKKFNPAPGWIGHIEN